MAFIKALFKTLLMDQECVVSGLNVSHKIMDLGENYKYDKRFQYLHKEIMIALVCALSSFSIHFPCWNRLCSLTGAGKAGDLHQGLFVAWFLTDGCSSDANHFTEGIGCFTRGTTGAL